MALSVLTIVQGRVHALNNLIKGLGLGSLIPDELIIVLMNEQPRPLHPAPFKICQVPMFSNSRMPLAAARNLAAKTASGERFVFLDVDCIPSPTLLESYMSHPSAGCLLNGGVRYLGKDSISDDTDFAHLDLLSSPDIIRGGLDYLPHKLFWSLNFSCTADDYSKIGGFDEAFTGYGAEDTDFAFKAREKGIEMDLINDCAYHQYHESFSPPLNHFADILSNAKVFYNKWGCWPMEGWLARFAEMGLIDFRTDKISTIRSPSEAEIALCKKS